MKSHPERVLDEMSFEGMPQTAFVFFVCFCFLDEEISFTLISLLFFACTCHALIDVRKLKLKL